MRQIDGRDAIFLYAEKPGAGQVLMPVVFFASAGELPDRAEILAWLVDRAAGHEVLTSRMVRVPFDLDHPYWVPDPDFDPADHITFHERACWSGLRGELARIAQEPLNLSRPLWEAHVFTSVHGVPGVDGEVVAVAFRFHHMAVDGRLAVEVIRRFFGATTPLAAVTPPPRLPSAFALWARAVRRIPANASGSARAVVRARSARKAMLVAVREGRYPVPKATRPRTALNQPLGPDRVVDTIYLSLSELKSLSVQIGDVTVNDLVLTAVARAVWAYLGEIGARPSDNLAAAVPFSESERDPAGTRNQFVTMSVDLHNDVADPVEQVRAIHRAVQSERLRTASAESAVLDAVGGSLPGFLIRGALAVLRALPRPADRPISQVNMLVSSVPTGPGELVLGDAVAVGGCSVVPLIGLGGVAHSASAVGDVFGISCTADPSQLTDLDRYVELIRMAFEEIRAAVEPIPVAV
ncbi:wax ester/triacylglycerol synthase domain-containing protein [Rhodococcus sp. NPDC003318]|uniref:wax ester/triacylglycerol synthase domain-containing protein n=1 Tax=Rhodococcus sp. NPDC003318 TaxID=3364503 RepID=UPI0036C542A6